MRLKSFCTGFLLAFPVVADAEEPAPAPASVPESSPVPVGTSYRVDSAASWVYVVVRNDRTAPAAGLGKDHAVRANEFAGTVVWDKSAASVCRVDITIPVASLRADPAGMRERAGLSGVVADAERALVEENLRSSRQLDLIRFPVVTFHAEKCVGTTGKVKVTGDLSIHGVVKPVSVVLDVTQDGKQFSAKGSFKLTHADLGMDPFTSLMGSLRNSPDLVFVVDLVGSAG